MHKNQHSRTHHYQPQQAPSAKKIQENNPYYQHKYDSYTPRKRYIKEHDDYDHYRISQLEKHNSFKNYSPPRREEETLNNSRIKKSSNVKRQQQKLYIPTTKHSQNLLDKYSRDMYEFEESDILKENTQKYVNKTTSRKQKLKTFAIEKDLCKNLYQQDQYATDRNINPKVLKLQSKQSLQNDKRQDFQEDICLTPRRLNKMTEAKSSSQFYQKMSNLQSKIAKLQKMIPKRSSTPKNSRILENSSYISTPQYLPNQILYRQRQQDRWEAPNIPSSHSAYSAPFATFAPAASMASSISSSRQKEIMSRVSLGRLVQQQEAQSQVQMIQQLSSKISSKLQSIIRNFG